MSLQFRKALLQITVLKPKKQQNTGLPCLYFRVHTSLSTHLCLHIGIHISFLHIYVHSSHLYLYFLAYIYISMLQPAFMCTFMAELVHQ